MNKKNRQENVFMKRKKDVWNSLNIFTVTWFEDKNYI